MVKVPSKAIVCYALIKYFALISFALVYLCGHFHTLGGLMPVLHTRHPDGTLELELGDWKTSRK